MRELKLVFTQMLFYEGRFVQAVFYSALLDNLGNTQVLLSESEGRKDWQIH